jgi:hypothetical protein
MKHTLQSFPLSTERYDYEIYNTIWPAGSTLHFKYFFIEWPGTESNRLTFLRSNDLFILYLMKCWWLSVSSKKGVIKWPVSKSY